MKREPKALPPHEQKLHDEHTRVGSHDGSPQIEVNAGFAGASDPRWVLARRLFIGATDEEVAAVRRAVLRQRRFFRVCARCGKRWPRGWLGEGEVCKYCAAGSK